MLTSALLSHALPRMQLMRRYAELSTVPHARLLFRNSMQHRFPHLLRFQHRHAAAHVRARNGGHVPPPVRPDFANGSIGWWSSAGKGNLSAAICASANCAHNRIAAHHRHTIVLLAT